MAKNKKGNQKKGNNEQSESGSSKWSDADNAMLIKTMTRQKANGYWGDNNPKLTAWVACVTNLGKVLIVHYNNIICIIQKGVYNDYKPLLKSS
jgi:hypothetical protein